MLREALTYPVRGADAEETLLVGAVLAVAAGGYLLVPALALALTVGSATGGVGMDAPGDAGTGAPGDAGGGASAGGNLPTLGTSVFVLGASTVVLAVSAAFAYLLPAALVGVADAGSLRAAIDRGRLRRTVGDGTYFVAWIAALLVGGLAVVLFGALASLGRPGEVVGLAGGFYALVVVTRLLGRGVGG